MRVELSVGEAIEVGGGALSVEVLGTGAVRVRDVTAVPEVVTVTEPVKNRGGRPRGSHKKKTAAAAVSEPLPLSAQDMAGYSGQLD